MLPQTPSQTVGPYFRIGLIYGEPQNVLVNAQTQGQQIRITGTVLDGEDQPVTDAMIEIWQADANGIFNHPADPRRAQADPNFTGFGRAETPGSGRYEFTTIKPGPVPAPDDGSQAPHINLRVFARGMLVHAVTRIYFADETEANANDPVLQLVPQDRRHTLIATQESGGGLPTYCFNIVLQGDQETAFFQP